MPTHWTYAPFKEGDNLYQGDIIAREPLLDVLRLVHNHFTDPKYLAFIVLTQTCDLVVRKGGCKAKHISLAVVRPLSALVPTVLEEMCQSPRPGVFAKDRREDAEEFLRKVLNLNEQAQGWVYLHPDADVQIGEPAVAMLRISISLRSKEHYDLIRQSRCGRLDTEYRNKLGWLKGNLYSRIDTTDWVEHESGEDEEREVIRELLDAQIGSRPPLWIPAAWIAEAKRKKVKLDDVPEEKLEEVLREHAPKPPIDVVIGEVKRVANHMRNEFTDLPVQTFRTVIDNDTVIMPTAARGIAEAIRDALATQQDTRFWALLGTLCADESLRTEVAATMKQAAADFLRRRGPRQIRDFVEFLGARCFLSDNARQRVGFLAEGHYGGDYQQKAEAAQAALTALKCPEPLRDHLRGVAIACIGESVAELVAARLVNSNDFKKSLRPE